VVTNRLPAPTTVHWHGIRLPVAMDGRAPHADAAPILPGGQASPTIFALPDAGTYWYHPHYDDLGAAGARPGRAR